MGAPWGKHQWLHVRELFIRGVRKFKKPMSMILPIAIIKDPYMWLGSMCRHSYMTNDFRFRMPTRCPWPLNQTSGRANDTRFESLIHLWSRWHGEYLDTTFPRLMVRYEDLLYNPEVLIGILCECLG